MDELRHEIWHSLEAHFRDRLIPRVASVVRPPGGATERVSPFTVVLLEGGAAGACWNLLDTAEHRAAYAAMDPQGCDGQDALEVARGLLEGDRVQRIVGHAACSALSQVLLLAGDIAVDTETPLVELMHLGPTDRVGLVGHAPPLLRQIASQVAQVMVLEREGPVPAREGVVRAASPGDLASCTVLVITSTTLLDDSFAEVERVSRGARFRAVYGPGAAIVPDALFRRGIDAIAGTLFTDGPALAERQRQGQRWGDAKRKFVLSRP